MGSKNVIWRALLAIPLLWAAGGVKAADLPSIKSPDITPAQPVVPPGYLFNLQPWGADLGRTLQNYGVYVTGRTINEGFDNISGGIKQGPLYEGYTSLGLDFDTHKLLGLPQGRGCALFGLRTAGTTLLELFRKRFCVQPRLDLQ